MARGQKHWFTLLQSLIVTASSSVHRTNEKEVFGVSRDELERRLSHMDTTGSAHSISASLKGKAARTLY